MEINSNELPIFYRKRRGEEKNETAYLIGIEIAHINYSSALRLWYIYYKNISDTIATFNHRHEVDEDIKHKVVDFLEDVLNIKDGPQT